MKNSFTFFLVILAFIFVLFTGGPGCSSLGGALFELGPYTFTGELDPTTNIPKIVDNKYAWSTASSVLFIVRSSLSLLSVQHFTLFLQRLLILICLESISFLFYLLYFSTGASSWSVTITLSALFHSVVTSLIHCFSPLFYFTCMLFVLWIMTGVGFSYAKNATTVSDDYIQSQNTHGFMVNFFKAYPEFATNDFFISGERYFLHDIFDSHCLFVLPFDRCSPDC